MSRPSDFSEDLCAEIAARVAERGINDVAKDDDMPSRRTIYRWMSLHPDFQRRVELAQEQRAVSELESILPISDEVCADNAAASRQRNRIQARIQFAEKLHPARFSPRVATGQAPELPQPTDVDPVETARRIMFVLAQVKVARDRGTLTPEQEQATRGLEHLLPAAPPRTSVYSAEPLSPVMDTARRIAFLGQKSPEVLEAFLQATDPAKLRH